LHWPFKNESSFENPVVYLKRKFILQ